MFKTVSIAGLGLIGASLAKATIKYTDCTVYGWNRTASVTQKAIADGVLAGEASDEILAQTDLLVVALFPWASVDYILAALPKLKKGAVVVDIVGVKTTVVDAIEGAAKEAGVVFIGGHPMAGLEVAGYENAFAELYQKASMILVPTAASTDAHVDALGAFFTTLGFGRIMICTKEEHDAMIAYTSQLAHVVSSAYVKSPRCAEHRGFSAGSYKDMTRVATLNEHMWTELFLLNQTALVAEIDELSKNLANLRSAIAEGDEARLKALLAEGREQKEKYH